MGESAESGGPLRGVEGPGSHGTLYAGNRKTTVKDRKKEIGKGLLGKMLGDLGIEKDEF